MGFAWAGPHCPRHAETLQCLNAIICTTVCTTGHACTHLLQLCIKHVARAPVNCRGQLHMYSRMGYTVGLISPVQDVYFCSETRQCKRWHQRAWRCGITQQVEQHTFLCSDLPPKKVNVAHRKRWTSADLFYSMTGVKAGVQVQGMPVR